MLMLCVRGHVRVPESCGVACLLWPCTQHGDWEPHPFPSTRIPDDPLPQASAKVPSLSVTRPSSLIYVLSHPGAVLGTKQLTLVAP